jgi:hypothetical protein
LGPHSCSQHKTMSRFLTLAVLAIAPFLATAATQLCNGHAEYCDRKFSNLTYIAAHDSFAVESFLLPKNSREWEDSENMGPG